MPSEPTEGLGLPLREGWTEGGCFWCGKWSRPAPKWQREPERSLEHQTEIHKSPCVLAGATEHANLCSDGVCLQYSLLVWMCVNTQGHAHMGAACLCSLPAVPRLGPFNSGAPAAHNLTGQMCLRHLLPWPHLSLQDNWGLGACSKCAEQVPGRALAHLVSHGAGAELESCRLRVAPAGCGPEEQAQPGPV